jgi:hypothetical protein
MLLKVALLLLVIVLLAKILRRRKRKTVVAPTRTEIDRWIDQELARELTKKLGLPVEAVRRSLDGEPEPEVVSAVEHAVRSVDLCYGRQADGEIEVRLDVRFEDGETFTATRRVPSREVPDTVREEYSRTGTARIYRPHAFPWSGGVR